MLQIRSGVRNGFISGQRVSAVRCAGCKAGNLRICAPTCARPDGEVGSGRQRRSQPSHWFVRVATETPYGPIFFRSFVVLIGVNAKRWSESPNGRHDYSRVCRRPIVSLPPIGDGPGAAGAVAGSRNTSRRGQLARAHQKVVSSGRLFVRALAIKNDLSRRILKQAGTKTHLTEQHKYDRLIARLAREYKDAMTEYLAAIRAVLKH